MPAPKGATQLKGRFNGSITAMEILDVSDQVSCCLRYPLWHTCLLIRPGWDAKQAKYGSNLWQTAA